MLPPDLETLGFLIVEFPAKLVLGFLYQRSNVDKPGVWEDIWADVEHTIHLNLPDEEGRQ